MTNAAVDVALRLHLKDQATPALDKAAAKAAEIERKTTTQTEQAGQRQRTSYERTSQAREALGVRSEQRIQREIEATEAAYKRLAATGKLSANEQARALDATRSKVTALTNEMGKLTAAQERSAKVGKALQYGGMAVATGAAGAYALRGPVQQAMAVDERLAHLANTAYRERDVRGKRLGMDAMRNAVDSATDKFGGTRAGATGALEELMASGAMTSAEAIKMLPSLVKAGTAANADPTQLAQIGIRAMQTFKVKPEDMPNVLNMALAAGQAGGFELKDMAKWLPQQMAAATQSGMSGRAGFAKLAALNQAAAITAGTKDEAGNNVVNLLSKINSSDTAKDAEKMGIDLPKYLQERRAKGVDSVDAFGELVNKAVQGRDDYKALQKQLASAKGDDEKRAALESMTTIAQGAGVGKLIQDRQALMALLGMMNNKDYMAKVLAEVKASDRGAGGAIDNNFELIAGTGAYKARRRAEGVQGAQDRVLGDGGSVLGVVNDAVADVAAKFPVLAGSTALAATAVTAMGGAAGLAAIALARVGGAGGMGGSFGAGGRAGRGGGGGPGAAGGSGLPGGASGLNRYGGVVGLGVAGTVIGAVAGEESVIGRYGKSAAELAAFGALFGPLGAAIGGATGLLVQGVKDLKAASEKDRQAQEVQKMQATVQVEFADVNDRLVARIARQKMETSESVEGMFSTGNIMTGAPL